MQCHSRGCDPDKARVARGRGSRVAGFGRGRWSRVAGLQPRATPPTLVPRLIELCYAYGVSRGNNPHKPQMVSSLKGFLDRNRAELLAQASPDPQQLEEECWTTLQKRVERGDDMFTVMQEYEGAAYTAHSPVMEEVADGPKQTKLVHSRGVDGKALYRVVKGRLGSTFNVDMKMRDLMVRFGGTHGSRLRPTWHRSIERSDRRINGCIGRLAQRQ